MNMRLRVRKRPEFESEWQDKAATIKSTRLARTEIL